MKIMKSLMTACVLFVGLASFSYPVFAQDYPTCSSASVDPDGDGWGWENNQSCIVSSSSSGSGDYPTCSSSSSDPDGDGWGWENNQSCVVSTSSSSGGSSGYPTCSSSSSDPDGDGWGWENNQSCIVSSSSGGSSSGSCGTGSCPSSLSCPNGMSCGCYTISGLGSNKRGYQDAGADRRFLASAMMETEVMDTNYAYGDNKTGDSFNAGATKQNWGMMRQCHSAWTGYGSGDYSVSAQMNSSRSLDVQVYNECRNYFGSNWFAGHRNGSSGLSNPNTTDINNFKAGYDWTYNQLSGHECDDVRFWVSIPAI
ncbi:carbohydrate-binding domain-containing protein [Teredinibacter haidensis]|uniref:carbohydrate-binding domain-containing protein n=1 Tax=Teredinibacter haidensis TaxID=2731755 RepID=UPI0009FB468A|nr:carbohydrate-binding domain-containing protein [Teredinibacter haidensis]